MYSFTRVLIGPKLARMLIHGQQRGEHDQDQADAVDADLVVDAEGRDPVDTLRRTGSPGGADVGTRQQRAARAPNGQQRGAERHGPDQARAVPGRKASSRAPTSGSEVMSVRIGTPRPSSSAPRSRGSDGR